MDALSFYRLNSKDIQVINIPFCLDIRKSRDQTPQTSAIPAKAGIHLLPLLKEED